MKKLFKGLGFAVLTLSLVACSGQGGAVDPDMSTGQDSSSTSSQSQASEASKAPEKDYSLWQEEYKALGGISRLQDYGHLTFGADAKVSMDRNATELLKGQEDGYLSGDYTIKDYEGDQTISTILYPFPADMHTAASYPTTEVRPEVQIDVTIPQSEIDRIGTENKETSLTLYGYQGEGNRLILTDGKGAESKLYIYAP